MEVINKSNFEQVTASGTVLVDFYADWCGPCKMLTPVLEQLQSEYGDKIRIVKVNVDDDYQLAEMFHVASIPNMVLFKDGKVCNQKIGYSSLEAMKAFIETGL